MRARPGPKPFQAFDLTPGNPEWVVWVQPVWVALSKGPCTTRTLARRLTRLRPANVLGAGATRGKRVRVVGGLRNCIAWLESNDMAVYDGRRWAATACPNWPLTAIRASRALCPDLFSGSVGGPAVPARRLLVGVLYRLGLHLGQIAAVLAVSPARAFTYLEYAQTQEHSLA